MTNLQRPEVTLAIAEKAASLRYDDITSDARAMARQCVLDWLAVARAGSSEPVVQMLFDETIEQASHPCATLVGFLHSGSMQDAALVNGTAGHALDYDDVNLAIEGHPTAPILPGLLALAEVRNASGRELIEAFVSGYETACRIGLLVGPGHYLRGFHATGTVGCFGAAAACGRLLGLDRDKMAMALGIAGTQAAGLKSMFGTMCKPLHCGTAARNGLWAANLAARGFDSRPDVLECEQGFAATQSADFNPQAALEDPQGGFHIRNNLFKFHAACYLTHAAIECAARLRTEHQLDVDDMREIRVRVDPACDGVCNIPEPSTGLEAKFSLRFTTAMGLSGVDTSAVGSYSDADCADQALVRLRDKVAVELVPGLARTYSDVSVVDTAGNVYETTHDAGVPAEDIDWQRRKLERKCHSLLLPLMGADDCEHLIELCRYLHEIDSVRLLTTAARSGSKLVAKAPSWVSQ